MLGLSISLAGAARRRAASDDSPTREHPDTRYIFPALGDSLIAGRGNPESGRVLNDDPYALGLEYVFDSASPNFKTLQPIAGPIKFQRNGGDHDRISPMERLLNGFRDLAGKEVGIIPVSLGGSSLALGWNSATPGAQLVAARDAINDAMSKFRDIGPATIAAIPISLGSNDTADQSTLVTRWLGLIDYLRANCPDITDETPFLITGGVEPVAGDGAATRAAAEIAASQRINVFVEHPPFPTAAADNLHPTMAENRIWGAALAAKAHAASQGLESAATITVNPRAGCFAGKKLSLPITHTGLSDPSRFGVVTISGGADAANFAMGGNFYAPSLIWADDRTAPVINRDYVVKLRVRNSAWKLGPSFTMTVTVTAADATVPGESISASAGYLHDAIITGAYGTFTVPQVQIKKGRNILFVIPGAGANSTSVSMMVGGLPAIQLFKAAAGNNCGAYDYLSAIDTTADVVVTHTGSAWGGIRFGTFVLKGAGALASAELENINNTAGKSGVYNSPSLTCPADGLIVAAAFLQSRITEITAPSTMVSIGGPAPDQLAVGYRRDSGSIGFKGANNWHAILSLAFEPKPVGEAEPNPEHETEPEPEHEPEPEREPEPEFESAEPERWPAASDGINAPHIALTGARGHYPPQLLIELDHTAYVDDTLRLQAADDYEFTSLVFDEADVLDSARLSLGTAGFGGLSRIASPRETYFRARVEWNSLTGGWSNIVKHGDITPPTLFSTTPATWADGTSFNVDVTASEVCNFMLGGADGALLELDGPQPSSSIAVRLLGNAKANYEAKSTYQYTITAIDLSGNSSAPLKRIDEIAPPNIMQWSNTNGKDKSQYINVSGSPRVFTSQTAKVGANCQVRALVGAIGKRQFEVQITSASTERFIIGLDDGSSVLGPALYSIVGSSSAPNGCSLLISPAPGSCTISANGRLNVQSGLTNATYHQGDIFTVEFDTTVGTVTFYRTRADSTVKIGTTLIECTWMAGGAKALVGSITTGQTTTANFGMTPFARRLSEGYLAYGDPE